MLYLFALFLSFLLADIDTFGYLMNVDTYKPDFFEIHSTGLVLNLTDDSSLPVNLGFSFPFYAGTFTQANVSSNGYVAFGRDQSDYDIVCPIPWAQTLNDFDRGIMLLHGDLDPSDNDNADFIGVDEIFIQQFDVCPYTRYDVCTIVEFFNVTWNDNANVAIYGQIVLSADGTIFLYYAGGGTTGWVAGQAGILDAIAVQGLSFPENCATNVSYTVDDIGSRFFSNDQTVEFQFPGTRYGRGSSSSAAAVIESLF